MKIKTIAQFNFLHNILSIDGGTLKEIKEVGQISMPYAYKLKNILLDEGILILTDKWRATSRMSVVYEIDHRKILNVIAENYPLIPKMIKKKVLWG